MASGAGTRGLPRVLAASRPPVAVAQEVPGHLAWRHLGIDFAVRNDGFNRLF